MNPAVLWLIALSPPHLLWANSVVQKGNTLCFRIRTTRNAPTFFRTFSAIIPARVSAFAVPTDGPGAHRRMSNHNAGL